MAKENREEILAQSNDMTPVAGTVEVNIPVHEFWEFFTHANWWSRWNKCFFWALNKDLVLGKQLIWAFQPIRWYYLYRMLAIARIVELEKNRKVTWEVTALPGFYARHTYHVEDLGEGRTRFGSWEKAHGWGFRLMKKFWIAHFTFVKDLSLEGAKFLEYAYRRDGKLSEGSLRRKRGGCSCSMLLVLMLLILVAGSLAFGWFYVSFVRQTSMELAPGIHAVFGGGGNSLLIQDGNEALLIDTKFPPGSKTLGKWVSGHSEAPVTKIVNTHYHYDHTRGNSLYPDARIFAHERVPRLMGLHDESWWSDHPEGVPKTVNLVAQTRTIQVGEHEVVLTHPGRAHTHGDIFVHLPKQNIIATGDLLFHTYYPFLDLGEGGVSIPDLVPAIRKIADDHPNAIYVPGHGPLARAADLRRFADYLEALYSAVQKAHKEGLTEDQAASEIDLSKWDLSILPSAHDTLLPEWATAESNIRWVYQLVQRSSG